MPLNVLHITDFWGIGGTAKAAELFVRNHGQSFESYGAGVQEVGPRAEALQADGFEVRLTETEEQLASYLAEKDIDIVHAHSGDPEMIGSAVERTSVALSVRTSAFGGYYQPEHASRIDRVFYPSDTILLRTLLLERFDIDGDWPSRMNRLYNPLDVEAVSTGESLRDEYGVPDDAPVVGKIGRRAPEKWGQITVSGFEHLARRHPEARLMLVGVPGKIQRVIRRRGLEDKVVYVDELELGSVSDFYASIDVLAHSSAIGESFGYVIAEAMANRVPVVVDSTPMRDNAQVELVSNGVNGYVANSAAAYGDAIAKLLAEPDRRRRFGDAARERATDFDVDRVTDRLEAFYEQLASEVGLVDEARATPPSPTGQKERVRRYSAEYDSRLEAEFGRGDRLHDVERRAWRAVTSLPAGRRSAFELLRKGFIFGNEYL